MTAAERTLIAAAWSDPVHFATSGERLVLKYEDWSDRLGEELGQILFDCGTLGVKPSVTYIENELRTLAIPVVAGEVEEILDGNAVAPSNDAMADLIRDVQKEALERSEKRCREITRDAMRAFIEFSEGKKRPLAAKPPRRSWRHVEYAGS